MRDGERLSVTTGIGTVRSGRSGLPYGGDVLTTARLVPNPSTFLHLSRPQNSSNPQTVTVTCPAGTQIVHIGGDLRRVRGHSVIDDFQIIPPNRVTVTGYEDQLGNPDVWATEAYASCAV